MKLYEVPRKSYINFKEDEYDLDLFFDHVDGMYSFCLDKYGNVVHLKAFADVEVLDGKPEGWD